MFEKDPIVAIEQIQDRMLSDHGIELFVKREDQIHPEVSGNKWRKLKYNFQKALADQHRTLLTFGGAYSNHIAAVAACAQMENFKSIGVIRGEELNSASNPTLQLAAEKGMNLHFIARSDYKKKEEKSFIDQLRKEFGEFYLIPEGGTNELAIQGTQEILDENTQDFDFITVSAGTGGTAAGIIRAAQENQHVLVFSSLKGNFLYEEIQTLAGVGYSPKWTFFDQYHFGGYARWNTELIDFINWFKEEFGMQLDPVYTGKMLFGLFNLIKTNHFREPARILAIHTGGLQGIAGFNEKNSDLLR